MLNALSKSANNRFVGNDFNPKLRILEMFFFDFISEISSNYFSMKTKVFTREFSEWIYVGKRIGLQPTPADPLPTQSCWHLGIFNGYTRIYLLCHRIGNNFFFKYFIVLFFFEIINKYRYLF